MFCLPNQGNSWNHQIFLCTSSWNWDSTVLVATRLQAGQSRIGIPAGARDFLFSEVSRLSLATTLPHIQGLLGFLGVSLLGHEVDCSPLSGVKVRNELSYASTPFIWPHDFDREKFSFLTLPPPLPLSLHPPASRLLVGKTVKSKILSPFHSAPSLMYFVMEWW